MCTKRFLLIENNAEFPIEENFCWYWDTARELQGDQPYIAVQCRRDGDPNTYVHIKNLTLLFNDQCEYFAVCPTCYYTYSHMQWAGSTRSGNWRQQSLQYLQAHQRKKGWCEFCDPVFGNGGWVLR